MNFTSPAEREKEDKVAKGSVHGSQWCSYGTLNN